MAEIDILSINNKKIQDVEARKDIKTIKENQINLVLIYQFFVFAVDYTRTEYLQYEDDDYYYYVKAVPKLTVSAPDVKVQRIYSRKNVRREKTETRE